MGFFSVLKRLVKSSWEEAEFTAYMIEDPRPSDRLIVVMGATGTGKSTFINTLFNATVASVGHTLYSHTGQCTAYELSTSKPYRVFIVDTPGFDDTRLSDAEVLRRIAYWLAASYREGGRVSGVIFLHTITNTRFLPATSFRALEKMCGPQAFGKVVLVTTMWDRTTNEEGEQVEKELETVHWRKMITGGAGVGRTTRNNPVSAQNIVNYLLEKTDTRPLLIQEEIVEDMLYPSETTAGQLFGNS